MNGQRPWEYPITRRRLDFGIFGVPGRPPPTGKDKPKRREITLLDAQQSPQNPPPKIEINLNQYQLGEEVVEMVREELLRESLEKVPWRNRLGLAKVGSDNFIIRPFKEPTLTYKGNSNQTFGIKVGEFIVLEGSDGFIAENSRRALPMNHPVREIVSDYNSGRSGVLTDYSLTGLWHGKSVDSLVSFGPYKVESRTNCLAVNHLRGEYALSLKDNSLSLLGEDLKLITLLPEGEISSLAFGLGANILLATSERKLLLIDTRSSNKISVTCQTNDILGRISSTRDEGRFFIGGKDSLCLFDLRILPNPAMEYDKRLIGFKEVSWLDWVEDRLCIYSSSDDRLHLMRDAWSGRPIIDVIKVGRPCQGLLASKGGGEWGGAGAGGDNNTTARLYMLFDDFQTCSWTMEELLVKDSIRERILKPIKPQPPKPVEQYDSLIADIYTSSLETLYKNNNWPMKNPIINEPLSSISTAAQHLAKNWIFDSDSTTRIPSTE